MTLNVSNIGIELDLKQEKEKIVNKDGQKSDVTDAEKIPSSPGKIYSAKLQFIAPFPPIPVLFLLLLFPHKYTSFLIYCRQERDLESGSVTGGCRGIERIFVDLERPSLTASRLASRPSLARAS